jgi:hypothetical protein
MGRGRKIIYENDVRSATKFKDFFIWPELIFFPDKNQLAA